MEPQAEVALGVGEVVLVCFWGLGWGVVMLGGGLVGVYACMSMHSPLVRIYTYVHVRNIRDSHTRKIYIHVKNTSRNVSARAPNMFFTCSSPSSLLSSACSCSPCYMYMMVDMHDILRLVNASMCPFIICDRHRKYT